MLDLIGRKTELFSEDLLENESQISSVIKNSKFLVLGAAGSIGQEVTKQIFKRNPIKLHVVDLSENNLVELVRDLRSSYGYTKGEFKTFALDIGSIEFDAFNKIEDQYDFVLNLSALKHVRSEEDPFTLMRMIDVNILNTLKTINHSIHNGVGKYFCVSSDKATNPANMMGASKRIMEMFLMKYSEEITISTARFANVAFSDGSLLHGFKNRIEKKQPIVAPFDIKRYFVTPAEAGELCLFSTILGETRDIFFPNLSEELHMTSFSEIAIKYLEKLGYDPYLCSDENEARSYVKRFPNNGKWPCLFTSSDTTGEKPFEEFYSENEKVDSTSYCNIGIIKNDIAFNDKELDEFYDGIENLRKERKWTKKELVDLFTKVVPEFNYIDKGKYLDAKM